MGDVIRDPALMPPEVRSVATLAYRERDDGMAVTAYLMVHGGARVCIGPAGAMSYDDFFCFHSLAEGVQAVAEWEGTGDPPGRWYRNGSTARRRRFDAAGGVIEEYVMR